MDISLRTLLAIGAGSFLGGTLRYLISQYVQGRYRHTFPIGTLSVNILGCFLIGLILGLASRGGVSETWRLFLATGIMGGFTTYSAFSYETVQLLRDGHVWHAGFYVCLSILLGLVATFSGIGCIKLL